VYVKGRSTDDVHRLSPVIGLYERNCFMATLVDDIVALEREADGIIAEAHAEAKQLGKAAHSEIASFRQEIAREVEERVAAFRGEMEKKHRKAIEEAESGLALSLKAIDETPEEVLKKQVDRIIARFCEW